MYVCNADMMVEKLALESTEAESASIHDVAVKWALD